MYIYPRVAEIQRRREQQGLTRYALSVAAGLNGNAIYRIETGESTKTHSLRAEAIAKVLHCKVSDIFDTTQRDGVTKRDGV